MFNIGPRIMAVATPWAAMILLFGGTGCATVMTGQGPDQTIRFNSNPTGALVILNGEEIGQTPLRTDVMRDFDHHVRIEREGYVPVERELRSRLNPWMLGNILIFPPVGTVIGLAVDIVSEAHRMVHPRRVAVTLRQREGDEVVVSP
jgi:hypothetical protein